METQVEKIMRCLGCDEQTALQVIEDDKRIDKGENLFALSKEQEQAVKKYRQGDRKPTVYNFETRSRKEDTDKRKLVELLVASMEMIADKPCEIANPERQFDFEFNGRKFRVVLSAPRK